MKVLATGIKAMSVFYFANIYSLLVIREHIFLTIASAVLFIIINIVPSRSNKKLPTKRLRVCGDGCELLTIFLLSAALSVVLNVYKISNHTDASWLIGALCAVAVESIVFWNGILRVYMTSLQIAVKWRLIGILCGWIPIVHLFVLFHLIRMASKETAFESKKIWINMEREQDRICQTKYPVLLVHGVFFRDFKYLNYWGRIPAELEKNGAVVYYGNQQSAASVEDCGAEIYERIRGIIEETGCEKVNIIAHSKGGLDSRYAISKLGAGKWVASITTINTPHRGCLFAEYLLSKLPEGTRNFMAQKYNATLRKLGDSNPDFLSAVNDLTASACIARNDILPDVAEVFYQSVGSKLNKATSGRFPLNFSYHFVKHFDGKNDGLVSTESALWGENHVFLTVDGDRGISHGDVIDLNRENIDGFDVREFYVEIVHDLKEHGF